jgi:hypothetical protein
MCPAPGGLLSSVDLDELRLCRSDRPPAAQLAAFVRGQNDLAEPDRGRSHLNAFVLAAELQRLLEPHHPRRGRVAPAPPP